ncbi:hypothetical protein [Noviherbaspirillum aerium]|nr:hypothetical protein [Noviherbaspirillum aerium]
MIAGSTEPLPYRNAADSRGIAKAGGDCAQYQINLNDLYMKELL